MPRPSKYPEQFRRDAVELLRSSGRTLRDVGRELGVNHETLRNWVNAAKRADAGQPADAEQMRGACQTYSLLLLVYYYQSHRNC